MLHELIDRDVPCCLYCNAEFDLDAMSIKSSSGYVVYKTGQFNITRSDTEILCCLDCQETFEIHSYQPDDGETQYTGFNFTCKGFSVECKYLKSVFVISDIKSEHNTTIPAFDPDFSDRDRLHEKLRTYLVFS